MFWRDLFSAISMRIVNFYFKGTPTKVVLTFLKLELVLFEAVAFGMPICRALFTKSDKGFWSLFLEFQFDSVSWDTIKYFLGAAVVTVVAYFITNRNEDKISELFRKIELALKGLSRGQKEIKEVVDENSNKLDLLVQDSFKASIRPILSLSDYSSKIYQNHGVAKPEDNDELRKKRKLIADRESGHIRVLALSGTGKTYQILQAFTETDMLDDVYYCDNVNSPAFESAIKELKQRCPNCTLILDNCRSKICDDVIRDYGMSMRIVSAHYDPLDRSDVANTISFEDDCLSSVINDIIESNSTGRMPEEQKSFIREHSGNIPLMALLLTKAYNDNGSFTDIHDRKLLDHLLELDTEYADIQRIAMRTIALFQPFDFDDGNSDFARYVINNNNFTSYIETIDRYEVFKRVVRKLHERTLIEKDSVLINMRPQPLACWLVGEWLKDRGSAIVDTLVDLTSQPKEFSHHILESWARRLEFMQGNKDAEDLYAELVKINGGPFANEDVVCSDFGSRLILAMTTVNPVAVSNCLYSILYPKTIDWLKENLIGDARRNLVVALEKLCFCKDTFEQSAHTLARLAVAENEDWANNSKGQILQLFHIALAGTECDLDARFRVLKSLYEDAPEYKPLLLLAIKGAYAHQNLHRMGGPEKFGFIELKDYTPTWAEIDSYWANIWSLMVDWMEKYPDDIRVLSDIVASNARRLVRAGRAKTLFEYIEHISQIVSNNWNSMHKALVEVKNFDPMNPQDGEEVLKWIEILTPKDIISRMKDAVHDQYSKVNIDERAIDKEESIVIPFVEEYIATKSYMTDSMLKVMDDKDYISWAFVKHLALQLPLEDIPSFWNYILSHVNTKDKTYHSSFLVRLVQALSNHSVADSLIHELYACGYVRLSISLMGVTDDPNHRWLAFCFDEVHARRLEMSMINGYLNSIRINDATQILALGQFMKEKQADNQLLFDHYATYWYLPELYTNEDCLVAYKTAVLNYPLDVQVGYNHEYNLIVKTLLEKQKDNDFASALNLKLIDFLSNNHSHYNVEELYKTLLTHYYDVVWPDYAKAVTDIDNHAAFFLNTRYTIGSGFDFEENLLYPGHEEEMKQLCKDYDYGAWVCAGTCPVFADANPEDGKVYSFHSFAIWLMETYGGKEHVIEEFSANMGTFHWTGSTIPLYEDQRRCLNDILVRVTIPEPVKDWARKRLKVVEEDLERERQNDAYMRMAYGRTN